MKHIFNQKYLDKKIIGYALKLSKRNIGMTGPNPSVAAIITKDNTIISTGITGNKGVPHAEIIAINKIKDKSILKNCEIYITLEPCSHQGKTPPCVDELIKHNFKRVIIAAIDPNPLVQGRGINKLIAAGIKIESGILEDKSLEINKRFFKSISQNIPYITLKLATSLDGKISCSNGSSKWITNPKSRKYAHYLRSQNDTILIGKNTLKMDNPELNCRIEGLEEFSPRPIILTNDSDLDLDSNLKIARSQPLIISTKNQSLRKSVEELSSQGINSILIEGGSKAATAFLKEGLVDEIIIFRSNKIIGGDGISMFSDMEIKDVSEAISDFKRVTTRRFDEDLVEHLKK